MQNLKAFQGVFNRLSVIVHPAIVLIASASIVFIIITINSIDVAATTCYTYTNGCIDLYAPPPCTGTGCYAVQADTYKCQNGIYVVNYMNTTSNKNWANSTPNSSYGSSSDTTSQRGSQQFYSGACTANIACTFTNTGTFPVLFCKGGTG